MGKHLCSLRAGMLLSMRALCCQVCVKNQPAAVGNDRRLRSIVSGSLFTMNGATPTCRAESAVRHADRRHGTPDNGGAALIQSRRRYVLEGSLEYEVRGCKPPVTLKAGDVLFIPAGTIHAAKNAGSGNGAELATYVVEKEKPLVELIK